MIKSNIKITNFSFTEEKIKVQTISEHIKMKNETKIDIEFYSIENLSKNECVLYFKFNMNVNKLFNINFSGKCNIIDLEGKVYLLKPIFFSGKNEKIYKKNEKIVLLIKNHIKFKCIERTSIVAKKHNILLFKVDKKLLKDLGFDNNTFKTKTILEGDEDLI